MVRRIVIVTLLGSLMLTGCLTRKPDTTRHYILEYPAGNDTVFISKIAEKSCLIMPAEVYPAFATHQIALRESSNVIRYFALNVWAVRPEQSITNMVTEFLHKHDVFESVYAQAIMRETDFSLKTTIYRLEVIGEKRDYFAHLEVEFMLINNDTGHITDVHRTSRKTGLEERDLNLYAAAISRMLIEELTVFTQSFTEIVN